EAADRYGEFSASIIAVYPTKYSAIRPALPLLEPGYNRFGCLLRKPAYRRGWEENREDLGPRNFGPQTAAHLSHQMQQARMFLNHWIAHTDLAQLAQRRELRGDLIGNKFGL